MDHELLLWVKYTAIEYFTLELLDVLDLAGDSSGIHHQSLYHDFCRLFSVFRFFLYLFILYMRFGGFNSVQDLMHWTVWDSFLDICYHVNFAQFLRRLLLLKLPSVKRLIRISQLWFGTGCSHQFKLLFEVQFLQLILIRCWFIYELSSIILFFHLENKRFLSNLEQEFRQSRLLLVIFLIHNILGRIIILWIDGCLHCAFVWNANWLLFFLLFFFMRLTAIRFIHV